MMIPGVCRNIYPHNIEIDIQDGTICFQGYCKKCGAYFLVYASRERVRADHEVMIKYHNLNANKDYLYYCDEKVFVVKADKLGVYFSTAQELRDCNVSDDEYLIRDIIE